MEKHSVFVGVDVSKSKFDVCVLERETNRILYQTAYENTKNGIRQMQKQLLREIKTESSAWLFCMEHTGVYTLPLSCFLSEQKLDYALVSGLEIHRSLGLKRGKSDKADAKDIARYACLHESEIKLYELPEKVLLKLRVLLTHRERLLQSKKMFANVEEAHEFMDKSLCKEVVKESRYMVKQLDKKIEGVNKQIQALIDSDEQLKNTYRLVCSVPGVGPQITCYLLIYTRCFTSFENGRQLACFAGVAPFEYSSGSSIRGKTKVSHLANKKLKALLNMGALNAKRTDPEIKLYYQRKVAEGKNGMLVMNAIRNKLIARIFATVKRGTPFVPLMQFAV
ncbi:MAG: transposase [Chitinophagales bacterium]